MAPSTLVLLGCVLACYAASESVAIITKTNADSKGTSVAAAKSGEEEERVDRSSVYNRHAGYQGQASSYGISLGGGSGGLGGGGGGGGGSHGGGLGGFGGSGGGGYGGLGGSGGLGGGGGGYGGLGGSGGGGGYGGLGGSGGLGGGGGGYGGLGGSGGLGGGGFGGLGGSGGLGGGGHGGGLGGGSGGGGDFGTGYGGTGGGNSLDSHYQFHHHDHHVDHHVKHHEKPNPKALALKGLLVPLAGVALLGAAAALVSNPVLLQLGVISGKRRRRDAGEDDAGLVQRKLSDIALLERFMAGASDQQTVTQEKQLLANYLTCTGIAGVGNSSSPASCLERLTCELHHPGSEASQLEKHVMSIVASEILTNEFVPEDVKRRVKSASKIGADSGPCSEYLCPDLEG